MSIKFNLTQPSGYQSRYFSREVVPVARQVWRAFCRHGASFIACRRDREISYQVDGAYPGAGMPLIPVDAQNPAKSMTNDFPLLSVLAGRCFIIIFSVF
jgi:hypothetical protein